MNIGQKLTYLGGNEALNKYICQGESVSLIKITNEGTIIVRTPRRADVMASPEFFVERVLEGEAKSKNKELLAFVAHRVQLCQQDNFYGSLTVIFENGKVVRTKTERSEVPS